MDALARLIVLLLVIGHFVWMAHASDRNPVAGCGQFFTFFVVWMGLFGGIVFIVPDIASTGGLLALVGLVVAIQVGLWAEGWGVMARLGRYIDELPAHWAGYPPPEQKPKGKPKRKRYPVKRKNEWL
ncbi:MAG: hypothetical protein JXA10_20180 [Anaerolineae bacterium]|nr:hypothetical protein [Anaerolineae bacterium]